MSNHAACTYPGAASRAGFPLDPMGHLCGPPCLSPRLPHRVIRISPSKGSQSQSSECSPDTNNNQSTNDTCRLGMHTNLLPNCVCPFWRFQETSSAFACLATPQGLLYASSKLRVIFEFLTLSFLHQPRRQDGASASLKSGL